jgi:hypothetical protein
MLYYLQDKQQQKRAVSSPYNFKHLMMTTLVEIEQCYTWDCKKLTDANLKSLQIESRMTAILLHLCITQILIIK